MAGLVPAIDVLLAEVLKRGCPGQSLDQARGWPMLLTLRGDPAAQQKEAAMRKHRDFDDLPCFRHHV
jgi:hypothetical protein